jgi:thiosulfate/3-mercaptopyruvate sulfurtransferase
MVLTGRVALVDVPDLGRLLAGADPPVLIDVRWRLGGPPGRDAYLAGHLPGASFLDLDTELCGLPGAAGRHPLPEPGELQAALRRAGVRSGHPVVVYDAGEGQAAARAWWSLRWAGHDDVRILDGGFAAWTAAGGSVEAGQVEAGQVELEPGDFEITPGRLPVLDAAAAAAVARTGTLVDARVGPRFRGETEPVDPVAGHIPGAVNVPAAELVDADGRLLAPSALREVFERAGVRAPVGAYCGSGVTAAQTMLALRLAGYDDAALYVGSWSNWVADPSRPVAVGE